MLYVLWVVKTGGAGRRRARAGASSLRAARSYETASLGRDAASGQVGDVELRSRDVHERRACWASEREVLGLVMPVSASEDAARGWNAVVWQRCGGARTGGITSFEGKKTTFD